LFVRVVDRQEALLPVLTDMVQQAALLAVVLLLAEAVRNRRRYMEEVRERLQRAEADREREAARQVAEERLRIARELHDVMAHTIAAITVQAGLAIDVLDDSPAEARAALGAIRAASREAMAEVKATVGVLRSGDGVAAPLSPAPGLDQVDGLIAMAQGTGLRVEVVVIGDPRPLSAAVDTTAYRIVQESLTNVIRHARASLATVEIRYEPGALELVVADNGIGVDARFDTSLPAGSGHGLRGMVERAAALGGWLKAGPQPSGGFLIEARLPTEEWAA
jgi:signal transduction histidine kinase